MIKRRHCQNETFDTSHEELEFMRSCTRSLACTETLIAEDSRSRMKHGDVVYTGITVHMKPFGGEKR